LNKSRNKYGTFLIKNLLSNFRFQLKIFVENDSISIIRAIMFLIIRGIFYGRSVPSWQEWSPQPHRTPHHSHLKFKDKPPIDWVSLRLQISSVLLPNPSTQIRGKGASGWVVEMIRANPTFWKTLARDDLKEKPAATRQFFPLKVWIGIG
jgi:hypothetical protein